MARCIYTHTILSLLPPLLIMYKMIEFLFDREFAKRFRVRGMSRDLSPISIKALKNFFNPYVLIAIDGIYSKPRFYTAAEAKSKGLVER